MAMIKFDWLHQFGGSIDGVLEYLNNLGLGVSWGEKNRRWWVATGEKVLLETDDRETAESFLMGMALAYRALPDGIRDQITETFST